MKLFYRTINVLVLAILFTLETPPVIAQKVPDCNIIQFDEKLSRLLKRWLQQKIDTINGLNGTSGTVIESIKVLASATVYRLATAQCEVTAVAIVSGPGGSGRVPIQDLPIDALFDKNGNLELSTPGGLIER